MWFLKRTLFSKATLENNMDLTLKALIYINIIDLIQQATNRVFHNELSNTIRWVEENTSGRHERSISDSSSFHASLGRWLHQVVIDHTRARGDETQPLDCPRSILATSHSAQDLRSIRTLRVGAPCSCSTVQELYSQMAARRSDFGIGVARCASCRSPIFNRGCVDCGHRLCRTCARQHVCQFKRLHQGSQYTCNLLLHCCIRVVVGCRGIKICFNSF